MFQSFGAYVTKIGFDALVPYHEDRKKFERVEFRRVDLAKYDIRSARPRRTPRQSKR